MTEQLSSALNGICPYFTMFPLDFPYAVLGKYASKGDWVLDPFCGRGTTNYASRLLGLPSVGIDSSPVAVALSQAKIAHAPPDSIVKAAKHILDEITVPQDIPTGEFWVWAFHKDVLQIICRLREGLLNDCRSDARKALRAILMGALHGPQAKIRQAYLSNQSPRTYAPKPKYAVKFWKSRGLTPKHVDVLEVVEIRARRYYSNQLPKSASVIIKGDSRQEKTYSYIDESKKFSWVITSPPYYGMRTYIPDQWLRQWFVGGTATVDYSTKRQIEHSSPDAFAEQLGQVWRNAKKVSIPNTRLVIRFGAINDRKANPISILKESLRNSGWRIQTIQSAGFASTGKRQALHFLPSTNGALEEYDIWACSA